MSPCLAVSRTGKTKFHRESSKVASYQGDEKGRLWLYENSYKKTDKHPILTGNGEIHRDVLRKLVEQMKDSGGDVAKCRAAAWERVSKRGDEYTFITIEPDDKEDQRKSRSDDIPF